MRAHKRIAIYLFLIQFYFTGCKKFVQIDPPQTQLVTASVFNNSASATSAQTAIYSEMVENSESAQISLNLGLLSDELTNYFTDPGHVQYYTNAMQAASSPGPWVDAYNYIYQANAIISAMKDNSSLSPAIVQQLSGEAKFVRAFWFFYLTNLYGDIPLVTSTLYTINATISRTAKSKVYQQIVSDLKDAQTLLSANYIYGNDATITSSDRTRPNKWTAAALLDRKSVV